MPGGGKTGPSGQGSRTVRGKDFCSGNMQRVYNDDDNRRGMGRRSGQSVDGRGPGGQMKGRGGF